ncbi:MAG: transporter [Frankiales bacterium]|nr:transporter [Frankiales bacterium]
MIDDVSRTTSAARTAAPPGQVMTHSEVMRAMSGLMLSMFVAMLNSTIVSNALPRILHDLHGGTSAYTWVVTATLLTTTASTPVWGKLSDLVSKKTLMQAAIVVFAVSSMAAGLSHSVSMLIACRAVQGIGAGGILAMTQVILASMVSPRERGRYSGYLGATFAVATIAGPLVGGVLVDSSLGWRACFYVGVPFAVAALVVLQRTLHLVTLKREAKVDYLGAALITGGVSALLVWVSLAGQSFAWLSGTTALYVAGGVVLLALAAVVELKVAEPVIPLRLFRLRTVSLSTFAGLLVGVAMFGATIFLAQYFQIARGESPTASGLRTLPMILGLATSSLVVGRLITRTGRWKKYLVGGSAIATVGFGLLSTIDAHTSFVLIALYMALVGIGLGATMQNLVLCVQNTVPRADLGAATATVAFFRSLGGAIGVSVLGAVLGDRVSGSVLSGLRDLGVDPGALGASGRSIPDVTTLPGPVAEIVEQAYGHGVADIFLAATPLMVLAVLAVSCIKEVPLRSDAPAPGTLEAATTSDERDDVALAALSNAR